MEKITKKKIIYVILILTTMSLIFWFSNQPGSNSSNQSNFIVEIIVNALNVSEKYNGIISYIVRKTAHFSIYFVLGFSVIGLLNLYNVNTKKKVLIALMICILYAISDEIHQLFVTGRSCKVIDILIDALGSFSSIWIFKKNSKM